MDFRHPGIDVVPREARKVAFRPEPTGPVAQLAAPASLVLKITVGEQMYIRSTNC